MPYANKTTKILDYIFLSDVVGLHVCGVLHDLLKQAFCLGEYNLNVVFMMKTLTSLMEIIPYPR